MIVDIVNLVLKGLLIGIIVSAPMGPVGVLCVQRTLNKGRWYGFVTGMGAVVSDLIYALITAFGLSFVVDWVNQGHNMFYLQLLGSAMLFAFGIYTFRSNPVARLHPVTSTTGTLAHHGVTAFFVTLSNPLIIFLFLGLFARFNFVNNYQSTLMDVLGFFCLMAGAMGWWFGLTYTIDKIRTRFDEQGIWIINRAIGVVVMVASVVGVWLTLTGKSLY